MFDKKKFSLPSVLQAEERKSHSIHLPKQEKQKKLPQFQHSFQFVKELHPATSRNNEKSFSSKHFNFTEYDIVSGKNPNAISEKTRNYIKNQTKFKDQNSSTQQIHPQLSICQDNGTIKNKIDDVEQKINQNVEDICNIVEIKNELKQLENGESSQIQQSLNTPKQKINKLESLFIMREGQNQQRLPQQSSLLDQYFVLKNGSTLQSQNSFEKSFLNQSTNNFRNSETNQIFRGSKFSIEEDSKNNFHQTNPNQTKYLKQIKQHSDILGQFTQEKYMKSPIFSKQGEEINNIIKQSRDHSNSIHLAMKSFQIEKGKKLFQFEKELMKIKENIISKSYFNFPSRINNTKSIINDSLVSQINQMNGFEEEKKQDINMMQINSIAAAGSIQLKQNAKSFQQNLFYEQESKLNQTIIKFITDKSILQDDFIKQVLNQENKEEQQNPALHFLRKRQMHFTQNPEVVDLLEQIDIHHKTLKNLGNQYQNNHSDFFKVANLDAIKKDILMYQKSFVQKSDYKICQEREESKQLQDWLKAMIDKVLKKPNNSFQQMFSELELIFHGCMQELVRQISIQCQERGEILCQIWNQYNYLISKLFSMHSVMHSRQNQMEYDRLKFLTDAVDKKQQEFMVQIKIVQQRLDEEFENNQKVNDQNFYLRKKLNKIEKEKNDLQNQFSSVQQEFNELQTHHQHVLVKFTELEEQLNDNILQSLNKVPALTNTINSSNSQNEQINLELFNLSQKLLQMQQDKLVSQRFIQQQQSKLNISSQQSKININKQNFENTNQQITEDKKTIDSAVSLENEIFVKNQEQKSKIEIEGINNVGINTSFKFFLDRVDACVSTTSIYENKVYLNQEVQTDQLEKSFQYLESRKQIKSSEVLTDLEYEEVVNKLNNHLLEMKNAARDKVSPEVYYKKLRDLRQDLLNSFKKKRVSIQEIKNKAINIQDQQQNIFKDVLQQLIESNSTVLEQKIVIAEKDIKIQGLEEQISSQQLKIDILKHTYIENQLNDSSQNSENLDQISFEQIIESSHLLSFNQKPYRSSNQIQLSTFRNIAERDSHYKDSKRKDIEQEFQLYQQANSINIPTQEAIKEQILHETQNNEELEQKVQQQGEESIIQNNEATSLSNTNNFSNHELSNTSINKIERQISNKRQSDITKKSKQASYLKNNKGSERKFSIQLINTNRSISNSPQNSQNKWKQNSNFKKPSISNQLNQTKQQKRDQYVSPKRKQIKNSNKQTTKGQPLLTKERASVLANKEAAELILETAKVVLVENTDYKQMNQIVKIINIIYNECIKQYKKGESDGQQAIIYILYDWFLHRFGVKNIAEKKLLDFLVQIRKSDDNPKIRAFGKIVGLYKTEILQFYDLQFFIKCMSLFEEYSNLAKTANIQIEKLKINKQQITDASHFFFGNIISKQGIEEFIQNTVDEITLDIENFRNILVKNLIANQEQNNSHDFDIDIISEKFLSLHMQLEEVYMQKYKGIFQIVQQANFIGLEEFLILIRNLNIKDLKEIEMVQIFKQKADQYNDYQLQMSLKRFCMLCQENKTLFEKDQKDFVKFSLQSNNSSLIENKIHNVQEIKNNWELLSIIIKTRFIYSKSYKTVYQHMLDQIQNFFQESIKEGDESSLQQKREQSNRIMLIFRILCEESRRNIINYETNQILGEPFSMFSESIRQQIHKIA
ncbi:hypothetical protein TTHERM_00389870 (macronuclear) [Tetrahymena thermophila SB210]|uniref:Uncharacterized protein n=1 Tax=Tetrahymena thermophila (strain SB210) TaxID=312017 RepID=Q23RA1_TETTS|nr:hypothetical protein TTHERM_00389870 [Tetrahymena thermophila SB210]EAR99147.2 hypothetical protein TTHERM_00389870 [Tetrahymena thermophila SB210]|eukprot:XP_001019392.2 hypothetical protein TTHERM_00389870 [Tetrahymena thermophila SB210]